MAGAVGIPDFGYFSKLFKRHIGISPREYKKCWINNALLLLLTCKYKCSTRKAPFQAAGDFTCQPGRELFIIYNSLFCYPISLPAIISLSTVITERLFLSSIAARIMPCDSTPHILRGARLVTTATFLPTISSGL